jgi:hypothetical protein
MRAGEDYMKLPPNISFDTDALQRPAAARLGAASRRSTLR